MDTTVPNPRMVTNSELRTLRVEEGYLPVINDVIRQGDVLFTNSVGVIEIYRHPDRFAKAN